MSQWLPLSLSPWQKLHIGLDGLVWSEFLLPFFLLLAVSETHQRVCICCSLYWDTLSPALCMACFLKSPGLLSKATSSVRHFSATLVTLGPYSPLCSLPLLILSPEHVSLPYIVYLSLLCFCVSFLSPHHLLEHKLRPSLNLIFPSASPAPR